MHKGFFAEALATRPLFHNLDHAEQVISSRLPLYEEVADMVMNHSIPVNDEKYEKWTTELKAELAALEG